MNFQRAFSKLQEFFNKFHIQSKQIIMMTNIINQKRKFLSNNS